MTTMKVAIQTNILEKFEDYDAYARVRFTMSNGTVIEVCHSGRQAPADTLTVRVVNGRIAVLPAASNAVHVMVEHEADENWLWFDEK